MKAHRIGLLACLAVVALFVGAGSALAKPVKVFILAGQSNMEGKAQVSLLEYQIKDPKTAKLFAHLHKDGKWVERDDVWIKFLDRKGKLTVGFGSPNCVGPELEFGNTVGNHYDEPVLLIKTAWGGKSLYRDFRPPSSGLPDKQALAKMLEQAQTNAKKRKRPVPTMDDIKAQFGHYYRLMLEEINGTLSHLKENFPEYKDQGYEIAGFAWFQGWNDMINPTYTAEYSRHMVNFIKDVRKDLKRPNLPFVIGVLGVGGVKEKKPNAKKDEFKKAQAAAGDRPEFKGNVAVVQTDQFWDVEAQAVFDKGWRTHLEEWKRIGSNYPFHYLGSHKTYGRIGKALAEAIIAMDEKAK